MNKIEKSDILILKVKVEKLYYKYNKLYKTELVKSENILEYWENEFFWWKKEAFEDMLNFIKNII